MMDSTRPPASKIAGENPPVKRHCFAMGVVYRTIQAEFDPTVVKEVEFDVPEKQGLNSAGLQLAAPRPRPSPDSRMPLRGQRQQLQRQFLQGAGSSEQWPAHLPRRISCQSLSLSVTCISLRLATMGSQLATIPLPTSLTNCESRGHDRQMRAEGHGAQAHTATGGWGSLLTPSTSKSTSSDRRSSKKMPPTPRCSCWVTHIAQ